MRVRRPATFEGLETRLQPSGIALDPPPGAPGDPTTGPLPSVSIQIVEQAIEGNADGLLRISRTGAGGQLPVRYSVRADSTAEAGLDYVALSGQTTIPAAASSVDVPVVILEDLLAEIDERIVVSLLPDSHYVVGAPAVATATIQDNDQQGSSSGSAPVATNPVSLQLARDTDLPGDGITFNAAVIATMTEGIIAGETRVEFDHMADGDVDGSVEIDQPGVGVLYDPRRWDAFLDAHQGPLTLRYRVTQTDPSGTPVVTDWRDYSYTLEPAPQSPYVVTNISHYVAESDEDIGFFLTGDILGDAYSGNSTNNGGAGLYPSDSLDGGYMSGLGFGLSGNTGEFVPDPPDDSGDSRFEPISGPLVLVQIDEEGNGLVDGESLAENLQFRYRPDHVKTGYQVVRARVAEWSDDLAMRLYGPWTDYVFAWSPTAPAIGELSLEQDTGVSDTDRVTSNPAVRGWLVSPFHRAEGVDVEYDVDGDGQPDGIEPVDSQGGFRFVPRGLSAGSVVLRARTVGWDPITRRELTGSWTNFSFHLERAPLPQIEQLRLLKDDGNSNHDLVTSTSTVTGQVGGESPANVLVEFDCNGDGHPDGNAYSDTAGAFQFAPADLAPGPVIIGARAAGGVDALGTWPPGPWTSLAFVLTLPVDEPPRVQEFTLLNDDGESDVDGQTSDPMLWGTVADDLWDPADVVVEFDHDGDGAIDGWARTDVHGAFTYEPVPLAPGDHQIRARATAFSYVSHAIESGPWTPLDFVLLDAPRSPVVLDLRLLSDSGPSADDGHTENAAIVGRTARAVGRWVAVQLDDDADGVVDQTVGVADDGSFRYQPPLLSYGPVNLSARCVYWDNASGQLVASDWTDFGFVFEDQIDEAPRLFDLSATATQQAGGHGRVQAAGRITNESSTEGVGIEIDVDGDGHTDRYGQTDTDGAFSLGFSADTPNELSLRVRTRELNPETKEEQYSDWNEVVVTFLPEDSTPAQISALELRQEPNDELGSEPRLVGAVSRAAIGDNLIVEFDHDADEREDGAASVSGDGEFAYVLQGFPLGESTIRVRTRESHPRFGVLRSDWSSFTFFLDGLAASSLAIQSVHLARDDGQSADDRSTSDPRLVVQLTHAPAPGVSLVEFDYNADGRADESVAMNDIAITHYPEQLTPGWVPLQVRATSTDGDDVSDWFEFGFVYSGDPDGDEARSLIASAASFRHALDEASALHNDAVQGANSAYIAASLNAERDYEQSIKDAADSQQTLDELARLQYERDLAAADGRYVFQMYEVKEAYLAAISQLDDSSERLPLDKFAWPNAPDSGSLTVPDDIDQPQPPVNAPTYSGPAYGWAEDPSYQAAIGAVDNDWARAWKSAETARQTAIKSAEDVHQRAVQRAKQQYQTKYREAEAAYVNAAQQRPQTDLRAAADAYYADRQAAHDQLEGAVEEAQAAFKLAFDQARSQLETACDTEEERYLDAVNQARDAYQRNVANLGGFDCEKVHQFWGDFLGAMHVASKTYEVAISTARTGYDHAIAAGVRDYRERVAAEALVKEQRVSAATLAFDAARATYDLERKQIQISAAVNWMKTKATLARDRDWAIADSARERDNGMAAAEREYTVALETAREARWQAEAAAGLSTAKRWNDGQPSSWTVYQLALAANNVNHVADRIAAHRTYVSAIADATYQKSLRTAHALRNHEREVRSLIWSRDRELATAKGDYWNQAAAEQWNETLRLAQHRRQLRDDFVTKREDFDRNEAGSMFVYVSAGTDAWHTYAVNQATATTLQLPPSNCSTMWITSMYTEDLSFYQDVPATTAATNWNVLETSLYQSSYDFQVSRIEHAASLAAARRQVEAQYQQNLAVDQQQRSRDLAGDLKRYHEALAGSNHEFAVGIIQADSVFGLERTAVDLEFAQNSALPERTFAEISSRLAGAGRIVEAEKAAQSKRDAAADYATALTTWHAAGPSGWTFYHTQLGQSEFEWAKQTSAAELALVQQEVTAENARSAALASAGLELRAQKGAAERERSDATNQARETAGIAEADAKLEYALSVAGLELRRAQGEAAAMNTAQVAQVSYNQARLDRLAVAETSFRTSMAELWFALMTGVSDADFAHSVALHETEEDLRNQRIDRATRDQRIADELSRHSARLQGLSDAFDAGAKQQWEQLQSVRTSEIRGEIGFRVQTHSDWLVENESEHYTYNSDIAAAARLLATTLKKNTQLLADDVRRAEQFCAQRLAELDHAYAVSVANRTRFFENATAAATVANKEALLAADASKREDSISARGAYETSVHRDHAAALDRAAYQLSTDLARYLHAIAEADAVWSERASEARDAYEDAATAIDARYQSAQDAASLTFTFSQNEIEAGYQSETAAAESVRATMLEHAAADFRAANVLLEADQAEHQAMAIADYDLACAVALKNLHSELVAGYRSWSSAIAAPSAEYYWETTNGMVPFRAAQFLSQPVTLGGGIFVAGATTTSGNYLEGIAGGYVFQLPNHGDAAAHRWLLGSGVPWIGKPADYQWQPPAIGFGAGQPDDEADDRHTAASQAAWKGRTAASTSAELRYVTAIGDAQIARAVAMGDASIASAAARGIAALAQLVTIGSSDDAYQQLADAARNRQLALLSDAKSQYAAAAAEIGINRIRDEGMATANWHARQNAADEFRAREIASREADFQLGVANAQATRIQTSTSHTETGEQAAAYARALAQWIGLMKPDFVDNAVELIQAEGERELAHLQNLEDRDLSRAVADQLHRQQSECVHRQRATQAEQVSIARERMRQSGLRQAQLAAAAAQQAYEIAAAEAQKQHAMAHAAVQRQFQIDRVSDTANRVTIRARALADIELQRAIAVADAKLAWQQAQTAVRSQSSLADATREASYTAAMAPIERQFVIGLNAAEAAHRVDLAAADRLFADSELDAENALRIDRETANVRRQLAEAEHRVSAHATIDSLRSTTWSHFLHEVAISERDLLAVSATEHLRWTEDTNRADATYVRSISAAAYQRVREFAIADQQRDDMAATAQRERLVQDAECRLAYVQHVIGPATAAANDLATAQRDRTVAEARATREMHEHEDPTRYAADLQRAIAAEQAARRTIRDAYAEAETTADRTRQTALAETSDDESLSSISADRNRDDSRAAADAEWQRASANTYFQAVETHSELEGLYWRADARFASRAMSALFESAPSPWSQYESARAVVYQNWVDAVSLSKKTSQIAEAVARRDMEIAQADAEERLANREAEATERNRTAAAKAESEYRQSVAGSRQDGAASGVYQPELPAVLEPTTSLEDYAVAAASDHAYGLRVLVTHSLTWYTVPCESPSSPFNDAFGVFDFGVSPPDGSGRSPAASGSAPVVLREPSEPALPMDFWDTTLQSDGEEFNDLSWRQRYVRDDGPLLQLDAVGVIAADGSAHVVTRSTPHCDREAIGRLLEADDERLAAIWMTQAVVVRSPQSPRPMPLDWQSSIVARHTLLRDAVAASIAQRQIAFSFPDDADRLHAAMIAEQYFHNRTDDVARPTTRRPRWELDDIASSIAPDRHSLRNRPIVKFPNDKVTVDASRQVIWRSPAVAKVDCKAPAIDTVLGTISNGWVWLKSGGRTTLSALNKIVGDYRRASDLQIASALDGIRSPYRLDASSQQIGVFIGGTGMHIFSQGNAERLFNLYQGTKFYYGGVANPVDYSLELLRTVSGWGWDETLDRAEADVVSQFRAGDRVHLFGWSRGAAMANELAKRLASQRIPVDFIGMYDPVYSYGFLTPGPDSLLVDGTWEGYQGNFVTATIAPQVKVATVIYAVNEDRTWFPATRFLVADSTRLITVRSPGGHGEVGGHWQSNQVVQHLNLRAMIEYARGYGGARLAFHGIEEIVRRSLDAPYTQQIAFEGTRNDMAGKSMQDWRKSRRPEEWAPYSPEQFIERLNTHTETMWSPAGYDTQKLSVPNPAFVHNFNEASSFLRDRDVDIQPLRSHYRRNLDWATRDLFDLYAGGYTDAAGNLHEVTPESIEFIKRLYKKTIDPTGGWRPDPTPPVIVDPLFLH